MLLIALLLLATADASAYEARLLDASGRPLSGASVSIAGRPGAVRTGSDGRLVLLPRPPFPVTLIIVGPRGETYPPLYLANGRAAELQLEPAYAETITVTTGAAPNTEATPAAATSVIGREDLEERKPEHLTAAVAGTPGVSVRGSGAPAVAVIRGLSGGRTVLMVDDARLVSERRAGPAATFLDPFMLASVEVARGPGSVAYGADALGGVVHARSRDPVPGQGEVRYHLSGLGERERGGSGGVEVSRDAIGGALLASVHARTADDAYAANGERILNSSYDGHGVALRYVSFLERSRVRLAFASDRASDVGAPAADALATRTYYPDETSDRFSFALDVEDGIEVRGSIASTEVSTVREQFTTSGSEGRVDSVTVEAKDASLRAAFTRYGARSRLHAGTDFVTRFDLRATGSSTATAAPELAIDDARKRNFGAFALYEHRAPALLNVMAGVRADHIYTQNRGGFFGDASRSDIALSGQVALTAGPWRHLTSSLQVSTGYREPTLSDRYYRGVSGRGFITGNPALEPERSLQYDVALRWQRGFSSVALTAYQYEIRDLVERYRSQGDFFFRNRGHADLRGVELEVEARLLRTLSVRAAAAFARGAADNGAPLDDIAAPNGRIELRHAGARYSLFTTASFHARDDRPGPVEVARPGYSTIDVGGGWQLHDALEVRLLVRNATNRLYASSADADAALAPGRSVMLSLNGRIGSGR